MQYIVEKKISVAYITESWLMDSNNHITFRIKCYGFLISHEYRKSGLGGGVCFIYKPHLKVSVIKHNVLYQSFEYHCIKISSANNSTELALAGIYRKQEVPFIQFYTDFHSRLPWQVKINKFQILSACQFFFH